MPIDTDFFNSNIAELLNDETLNSIAIELTSGIEKTSHLVKIGKKNLYRRIKVSRYEV